jgi:hypothetical protein
MQIYKSGQKREGEKKRTTYGGDEIDPTKLK